MSKKKPKRHWSRAPTDLLAIYESTESDRGAVLTGAARIEHCYERLLIAHFRKVGAGSEQEILEILNPQNPTALLGSGWAKAKIAHLLGLVSAEHHHAYDAVRQLRNEFAHSPHLVEINDEAIEPFAAILEQAPNRKALEEMFQAYADQQSHKRHSKPRVDFMVGCFLACMYVRDQEIRINRGEL